MGLSSTMALRPRHLSGSFGGNSGLRSGTNLMDTLLEAILADDRPRVEALLRADPRIATRLIDEARLYESTILHWLYVGDTALHLAAAGYRVEIVRRLLAAGADPNAASNHRHSGPLHYAADGS